MIQKYFVLVAICCSIQAGLQAQTSCDRPAPADVFTPNDDGINDKWEIMCLFDFPDNELTVFNRWGAQVYKASGYDQNWDGTNATDNKPLEQGTYVYVLHYTDQQEKQQVSGTVTIVR